MNGGARVARAATVAVAVGTQRCGVGERCQREKKNESHDCYVDTESFGLIRGNPRYFSSQNFECHDKQYKCLTHDLDPLLIQLSIIIQIDQNNVTKERYTVFTNENNFAGCKRSRQEPNSKSTEWKRLESISGINHRCGILGPNVYLAKRS